MSAKNEARRVELRLKFENVKAPLDINKYLSSMTYTDEEEDNADDLQLVFDDRERKWLGDWLKITPSKRALIPLRDTHTGKRFLCILHHYFSFRRRVSFYERNPSAE